MLVGEMSPSKGFGDPLYDIQDERIANITGLLFSSHPEDAVNGIYESQSFDALTAPGQPYAHIIGKNEQLTVNTPLATFSKYSDLKFLTNPNNKTPNMTIGDVMRTINDQLIRNGGKPRFLFENYLVK